MVVERPAKSIEGISSGWKSFFSTKGNIFTTCNKFAISHLAALHSIYVIFAIATRILIYIVREISIFCVLIFYFIHETRDFNMYFS